MNYKKIFPTRSLRHKILKALSFVPDRVMIKLQYRIKMGFWPNLKNPERYSEKLQAYKLYYRNPLLHKAVDKYAVREYLHEKGLDGILPDLYGIYEKAEDIDFEKLPDRFVLKTNDGSGGHNVLICRDKKTLDKEKAVEDLNSWLNIKDVNPGREWAYTGISKSMIIAEEYLENSKDPEKGLEDYKFYCFHGEPYFIAYDGERYIGHKRNFYDLKWNNMHIESDWPNFNHDIPKPENLEEMIKLARILSKDFPHVRVDLYSVNNQIYFGELTFYPLCGYVRFTPDEFDFNTGRLFNISSFMPARR